MSLYDGTVRLQWPAGEIELRFDYSRLELLQAEHGDDRYLDFVSRAVDGKHITSLVQLAAIASGKTNEEVRNMSPPILELSAALARAWQAAWYGPDKVPEAAPEKTMPRRRWEFARPLRQLFELDSGGATSGV